VIKEKLCKHVNINHPLQIFFIKTLNKVVLAYDLRDYEILQESEGILNKLDSFIAREAEEFLDIKLQEYGVEITYDFQNELE